MRIIICLCFFFGAQWLHGQLNLDYQKPPKDILDLVDVDLAPTVWMDDDRDYMLMRERNAFKSITELSEKEMRLGGLRINPKTNTGSRTRYYNNVRVRYLKSDNQTAVDVSGLPESPRLSNFSWSPDQEKIAFTHTTDSGLELWYLDMATAKAHKLTEGILNGNMGDVINWFENSTAMIVKVLPEDRKPLIDTENAVPTGPTISVASGEKAQNRTYQDLLQNKNDEHNFEQLAQSVLYKIKLEGSSEVWLPKAMYRGISFSPDGNYIMVTSMHRPFSYIVPYSRFPSKTIIYTKDAQQVSAVNEMPLLEVLPKGFMSAYSGKRNFSWRSDLPATLYYAVALDGGDPEIETEYRDEVFQLEAPFKGEGKTIMKTINRFSGIMWGDDDTAIAYDYWWNTRNSKAYLFDPGSGESSSKILWDRNYQDRYSAPGNFVTERNEYGSNVLSLDGDYAFLIGDGFTAEGQFPFLDRMNLMTAEKERLYQSEYTDKLESIAEYEHDKNMLMVSIQSATDFPNYYMRDLSNSELTQMTFFENPFEALQGIHKEVIHYKREDGLDLSGTLYLPADYDPDSGEKLPMILWAYPREYKDKSSASQTTSNPNEFTYPYWGSPIYWVTKGYAVLDDAAFPIVGEGEEEPNDSFRTQLVANGKAAIDAVDELGYIDRERVAVGGHSYGAFMVANLLSHSNLFAAGIARSGAYNRTLTPFGFQSESRSYWEAPEVYYSMSPFMHADKMKTPLLLIHGEADNNSGTYPMQSERYFNALKGLGATVRLVMFPKESHGYAARESILHLLWEQDQWLEKYVKNKDAEALQP